MKIIADDPITRNRLFKCHDMVVLSTLKDIIEIFQIAVREYESVTLVKIGFYIEPNHIISIYDYVLIQLLYDSFGNIGINNLNMMEDVLYITVKNDPTVYIRNYHLDYFNWSSSLTNMYFQEYIIGCDKTCYEQTDPYYQWITYGRNYY